jgi:cytoskeletal protein RodZ
MSENTQANAQNVRSTGNSERDTIVSAVGTRSLGQTLRDARLDRGLELKDVASRTRVRSQYLLALEEGNYEALPENVYTRNFIRLYAQALDLDAAALLEQYNSERGGTSTQADSKPDPVKTTASRNAEKPVSPAAGLVRRQAPAAAATPAGNRSSADFGSILPTLLLVAVIVGLGIWAWQSQFFSGDNLANTVTNTSPVTNATTNATDDTTPAANASAVDDGGARFEPILPDDTGTNTAGTNTAGTTADTTTTGTGASSLALLSIRTVPEGARVSIDNYEFPELSPIENAPLSAGENRTLRVELEGYEVYETPIDLSFDRSVEVFLTPVGEASADAEVAEDGTEVADTAEAGEETAEAAGSPSTVSVEIVDAASWLEVYQGNDRGVGTTLLYRTAEPGETFEYETPVFLFAGNAGNVLVSVDGGEPEAIGSAGQVTGQAFGEEDAADENANEN